MAKLSKGDVIHVAKLAKLDLSDAEVEKFRSQLSKVIDQVGELSEVDTSETEAIAQTTGLENVERNDEIKPENCFSQDKALGGTDSFYNGYFKVKAILTERTDK